MYVMMALGSSPNPGWHVNMSDNFALQTVTALNAIAEVTAGRVA